MRMFMRMSIGISKTSVNHERTIYGFFDVLGDFGGVVQVLEAITALILAPIASMNFNLRSIEKLFLAKTKDDGLFQQKKNQKVIEK